MKMILKILYALIPVLLVIGCQDLPPDVYEPKTYVEAYLIVDHPFEQIKIMTTQSLSDSFKLEESFVRDADVFIHYQDKTLKLVTDAKGTDGYYYPDTSLKVMPQTEYELEIRMKNGGLITAKTMTPQRFQWINEPPPTLQYPKDTINFSDAEDTLKVSWTKVPFAIYYFVRITCLDTALYGKYLNPPTLDSNRRVFKPFVNPDNPGYNRTQTWGFVPVNEVPVVWTFFKWYGKQRISILTPDFNFLKWSLQYFQARQYDPLLGNVKGDGIGIFGSASEIDAEFFLFWPPEE